VHPIAIQYFHLNGTQVSQNQLIVIGSAQQHGAQVNYCTQMSKNIIKSK
jgi:hypothetical protein